MRTKNQLKEQQIKDVAAYKALAKKYNNLVMKGKIAKSELTRAAIIKKIEPIAKELEGMVNYMKLKYPQLIAK